MKRLEPLDLTRVQVGSYLRYQKSICFKDGLKNFHPLAYNILRGLVGEGRGLNGISGYLGLLLHVVAQSNAQEQGRIFYLKC